LDLSEAAKRSRFVNDFDAVATAAGPGVGISVLARICRPRAIVAPTNYQLQYTAERRRRGKFWASLTGQFLGGLRPARQPSISTKH
jgi:hypothetical protein